MRTALVIFSLLNLAAWPVAADTDAPVPVRAGSSEVVHRVKSVIAFRRAGVVLQGFDYSCGSASLATLLTYGTGDGTTEAWVLQTVFETATPEQKETIRKKGLSLLDLQRAAEKRGLRAQGFRVHAGQVGRISRPVIVHIRPQGYEHFAVLKGIRGGRVYLADPSFGNVRLPLYRFVGMWADGTGRGIVFAVEPKDGRWPAVSLLDVPPGGGPPLEAIAALELAEVGKAYPLPIPDFAPGR